MNSTGPPSLLVGVGLLIVILILVGMLIFAADLLLSLAGLMIVIVLLSGFVLAVLLGPYYVFKPHTVETHGSLRLEDQKE